MNGVDDAPPAAMRASYAARTDSRCAPSRGSPSASFTFDAFTTDRRESLKMIPRYVAATSASTRTPNVPPMAWEKKYAMAPADPAHGSVITQANATLPTSFQRTGCWDVAAPTPTIDPVATCVVESGRPMCDDVKITADDAICAAKPCCGVRFVNPLPIVRMIRQPPIMVPSPIAIAHEATTHHGVEASARNVPLAINAKVTTPMVFCASLVPCANESSDDDPI